MVWFFFNDAATTEIYTLSLHDALPICGGPSGGWIWVLGRRRRRALTQAAQRARCSREKPRLGRGAEADRKSTRLNSSHANISYAVFCLTKNYFSSSASRASLSRSTFSS